MGFLIVLILGFLLMWLLIVLPQRRQAAAHRQLLENIAPGDYVVTAGGLYGTVTELGEEDLGLEIAPDVEVRVARRSIGAVIPPEEIEEIEEGGESGESGDGASAGAPAESAEADRR